jgi:hypothetical protein
MSEAAYLRRPGYGAGISGDGTMKLLLPLAALAGAITLLLNQAASAFSYL